MKKLIVTVLLLLTSCAAQFTIPQRTYTGSSGLSLSPGWTVLQDTFYNPGCAMSGTTCTQTILPTTAGSVWAAQIVTGNNTAISAANGWTLCPASNCHQYTGVSGGGNMDAAYQLGGSAGTTSVTVTTSTAPTGFWGFAFVELLPPAGYTASFDTSGSVMASGCTVCTAVPLTLTATDAVIEFQIEWGNDGLQGWNAWSAPFYEDVVNNGIYMNAPNGSLTAPTLTQTPSGELGFSALAFKSTAGNFTVPAPSSLFTLVNYTYGTYSGTACTPTCSITIPSTGSGHLLFVQAASSSGGGVLSSLSGGGTWVVPSGANTCALSYSSQSNSCGYVLSSTSGVTSLSLTMSATGAYGIDVYEVSRSSGSFALDTQNSLSIATSTNNNVGPALTLSGTNDVIFQEITGNGFYNSSRLYLQPYVSTSAGFNVFFWGNPNGASTGIRLNTADGSAAQWLPQGSGSPAALSSIAFK